MATAPPDHVRDELRTAVHESLTTEFTTLSDGRPATVPVTFFYDDRRDRLVTTTPPAFSGKADNVKDDSKVSVLFSALDEPLFVTGDAVVRDNDMRENARYVQTLIQEEPDTPKRRAFEGSMEKLTSPVGSLLLDWYALRIVIEVRPRTVARWVDGDLVTVWEADS